MASRVLEGAVEICREAGIPLAGGHSIDISDPIFGLCVTGIARKDNIKQNNTAMVGNRLFLTKPLGVGILSTAAKKNLLEQQDYLNSVTWMTRLNSAGTKLGTIKGVTAMTDVTGFGLLGHLIEMAEGSDLSAEIYFDKVPFLPGLNDYMEKNCIPGGTYRNWKSYGVKVSEISESQKYLLADPQTSGGLLIAAGEDPQFDEFAVSMGFWEIGKMIPKGEKVVKINYE
jgi:selenide,water dikinase